MTHITHCEILCLAISKVQEDIQRWEQNVCTQPDFAEYGRKEVEKMTEKLDMLKQMYLFEVGYEYC